MKEGSSFQEFQSYTKQSSRKPSFFLIVFVVVLLLVITSLVGLYFLGNKSKNSAFQITPTPTIIVTPTPTLTSTPAATTSATVTPALSPSGKVTPMPTTTTLDKGQMTLAVLNGSGQPGAANTISSKLTNLGYTVSLVGNADNFSYTGITIKIKKITNKYLPVLQKDVTANANGATVTVVTDDTVKTDAQVIIGK